MTKNQRIKIILISIILPKYDDLSEDHQILVTRTYMMGKTHNGLQEDKLKIRSIETLRKINTFIDRLIDRERHPLTKDPKFTNYGSKR